VLLELVNSSLHTSVPGWMLGVKVWLAAVLEVPAAMAIALTVRFEATRKGAWYCWEDAVGVLRPRCNRSQCLGRIGQSHDHGAILRGRGGDVGAAGPFPPVTLFPLPPPHPHITAPARRIAARVPESARIAHLSRESGRTGPAVRHLTAVKLRSQTPTGQFPSVLSYEAEKTMSNAKQQVESLLHNLPENCSLEDIQYHLYVLEKVRRGLGEASSVR